MQTDIETTQKLNFSVLYVEDDEHIRNPLGRILSTMLEKVYTATNGEEGLELFKKVKPDFVITDISMPIMNGIELCRQIREGDPLIPVVVMTAHSDVNNLIEAIKVNVTRFMVKPIDLSVFKQEIREVCKNLQIQKDFIKQKKLLEEYKRAVDMSNIISISDLKGVILYANDEFCRISGYSKEELIGQPHNLLRHPNMPKEAFEELWRTILAKQVWSGIVENRAKDGSSYWVDATIIPILDENNEVVEFIGVRKDITKMIMQEKEIERLNAERLKNSVALASKVTAESFLQLSPIAAAIVDKEGRVATANDELLSMFDPLVFGERIEFVKSGLAKFDELFDIYEILSQNDKNRLLWEDAITWLETSGDSFVVIPKDDVRKGFKMLVRELPKCEEEGLIVFFLD